MRDFSKHATDQEILSLWKKVQDVMEDHQDLCVSFKAATDGAGFHVHIEKVAVARDVRWDQIGSSERHNGLVVTSQSNPLYEKSAEGSDAITASSEHFVSFPSLDENDHLVCPKHTEKSIQYTELPSFLKHASDEEKVDLIRFIGTKSSNDDVYFNAGKIREIPYLHAHILSPISHEGEVAKEKGQSIVRDLFNRLKFGKKNMQNSTEASEISKEKCDHASPDNHQRIWNVSIIQSFILRRLNSLKLKIV